MSFCTISEFVLTLSWDSGGHAYGINILSKNTEVN